VGLGRLPMKAAGSIEGALPMAAPAAELQDAIFSALNADAALVAALGGARIYAEIPKNVVSPYVTFGRTSVYDWSTGTELDSEQLFTLHVWSKAKGDAETLGIMEIIGARLADTLMPLAGRDPVRLKPEFFEQRYDEDLAVHHGLLRFRAVAEASPGA
jgi:hypothetical protein